MKQVYLWLAIAGTAVPLLVFAPWLADNGLNFPLLWREITASRPSAFAWADVVIAVLAVFAFAWHERRRVAIRPLWLPVAATLMLGVSAGLPLLLYLREKARENNGLLP